MTRALVVWEDEKFEALGAIAKRVVRVTRTASDDDGPRVLSHKTKGNGMFGHYVAVTWTNVRRHGLPTDPGSIDHLIGVVDADVLHRLVPGVEKPPVAPDAVAEWHANASSIWQRWLRDRCDPAGPAPTTVHGVVLRWAKESVVLAGYDQPAAASHLGVDPNTPDARTMLDELCPVHPGAVAPALFTDTFRRPLGCLDLLRRARKLGALKKNAPAIDDAIKALMRDSLAIVRARVPDLDRLAALIWDLHRGGTP